jgi:hypothetical protein
MSTARDKASGRGPFIGIVTSVNDDGTATVNINFGQVIYADQVDFSKVIEGNYRILDDEQPAMKALPAPAEKEGA